jgi:hypothetical protein
MGPRRRGRTRSGRGYVGAGGDLRDAGAGGDGENLDGRGEGVAGLDGTDEADALVGVDHPRKVNTGRGIADVQGLSTLGDHRGERWGRDNSAVAQGAGGGLVDMGRMGGTDGPREGAYHRRLDRIGLRETEPPSRE